MGKIRSTASMLMRGRIGNTTFYTSGGRQLARAGQNSSNYGETARRTLSQQEQRVKWANLVNFYKLSKRWMPKAYETRKPNQSDYNVFMSKNVATSNVYLTKAQAAAGGCVVLPFMISEGSLPPIGVQRVGSTFETSIALGALNIDNNTTVAQLTQAILANNVGISEGCQLSFISYQQDTDANGVPRLTCAAYELTLDINNTESARNYLPDFCLTTSSGYLATSSSISTGAFAYIWSNSTSGRQQVSTQYLVNNNDAYIAEFSKESQKSEAIESYGLDTEVFLASGSNAQQATPAAQSIRIVKSYDGTEYKAGDNAPEAGQLFQTFGSYVEFANPISGTPSVVLKLDDGNSYNLISAALSVSGNRVVFGSGAAGGLNLDKLITRISVTVDGGTYDVAFVNGGNLDD